MTGTNMCSNFGGKWYSPPPPLSRALQAKTADFTLVASQLTYVQHSLQQIKERPNDQEYLSTVHDRVTDLAMVL